MTKFDLVPPRFQMFEYQLFDPSDGDKVFPSLPLTLFLLLHLHCFINLAPIPSLPILIFFSYYFSLSYFIHLPLILSLSLFLSLLFSIFLTPILSLSSSYSISYSFSLYLPILLLSYLYLSYSYPISISLPHLSPSLGISIVIHETEKKAARMTATSTENLS